MHVAAVLLTLAIMLSGPQAAITILSSLSAFSTASSITFFISGLPDNTLSDGDEEEEGRAIAFSGSKLKLKGLEEEAGEPGRTVGFSSSIGEGEGGADAEDGVVSITGEGRRVEWRVMVMFGWVFSSDSSVLNQVRDSVSAVSTGSRFCRCGRDRR
jgi:hypothetical protein